jgi:hypothetical protein
MRVQLGFMGVQLGDKGHRGQVAGEAGAVGSSEAVAALSRGRRLVMRLPQPGLGTGRRPSRRLRRFRRSKRPGCAAGWHCRLPWPVKCLPGRASVVLACNGDRSPFR